MVEGSKGTGSGEEKEDDDMFSKYNIILMLPTRALICNNLANAAQASRGGIACSPGQLVTDIFLPDAEDGKPAACALGRVGAQISPTKS